MLLFKFDLKWCIHLSKSLFQLIFQLIGKVTAGGPVSPRGHMQPSSTVDFGSFVAFWDYQNFYTLYKTKLKSLLFVQQNALLDIKILTIDIC